jgi:hypothetical protein
MRAVISYPPFVAVALVVGAAGEATANPCTQFGYSGRPQNAASCTSVGDNQRTITCQLGYYAVAPDRPSVTLTDSQPFAGCTAINECAAYGYSGRPNGAVGCTDRVNQRTITCQRGYFVRVSKVPTDAELRVTEVTLTGAAAFTGCEVVPHCRLYGDSGRSANLLSCTDGRPNERTLTCKPGYYAVKPDQPAVTLRDGAAFAGCVDINECLAYGYSGRPANAASCTQGLGFRTIMCKAGHGPVLHTPSNGAEAPVGNEGVNIFGKSPFLGCIPIPG